MPTPALSREVAEAAVARVEDQLRLGKRPPGMTGNGAGAIMAAAMQAIADGFCKTEGGFATRVRVARDNFGIVPDETLYRPQHYQQPMPRVVTLYDNVAPPSAPTGDRKRVLVIGDLHQCPKHPERLAVLTWIARHASAERYDRIIQIGDWSTWDSCSAHDKNDTYKGRLKPSIRQDLDNLTASHQAFRAGLADDYKPKLDFLHGNHEHRVERFENAHPEALGTHTLERDQIFLQFGWRMRPYGELFYVGNVAFTHHPVNGAGRAFGGKTGPQRAANESTVCIVSGHTHRRQLHDCPKIGPMGAVTMIEVGCAMPWGTIEAYAQHSNCGWWWGVCDLTIQEGAIPDVKFISMTTLEQQYA